MLSDWEKNCEVANETTMKMTSSGHVIMKPRNQDTIILHNVWHSPDFPHHLLSLLTLTKSGYTIKNNQTATTI